MSWLKAWGYGVDGVDGRGIWWFGGFVDLIGHVLIGCECRGFTNPKTGAPSGCRVVFIKSWRANMRHLEKSQGVPSLVG